MNCSDIISIIDIAVSAGVGIWVATAIAKGQTKERFLKEYFTHELISIKEECKIFFDDICYDQKSANDIKTGFKILSMRAKAFEDNLREAFKNSGTCIHSCITKIQIEGKVEGKVGSKITEDFLIGKNIASKNLFNKNDEYLQKGKYLSDLNVWIGNNSFGESVE